MQKKIAFILLLPLLQACSNICKDAVEIKNIPAIKASDKNLTCMQIEYELMETDHRTRTLKYQLANIPTYSEGAFNCLLKANAAANKGLINAQQRLDYLFQLYEFKRCDRLKPLPRLDSMRAEKNPHIGEEVLKDNAQNSEAIEVKLPATPVAESGNLAP